MTSHDAASPGWRSLLQAGQRSRVAVLCLGVWLHAADSLLVATLIPSIIADIGGTPFIAWTIALYELGSITAGAASGLLALRFGLRLGMRHAALLYAAGCVVSAAAISMEMMLVGRLLQGLGGGALVAMSLVAASRLFPGPQLPHMLALISAVWGASAFTGPLIGGIFAELGHWRGGFAFFAVQAVGLALVVSQVLRNDLHTQREDGPVRSLPWRRLLVLSLSILSIASAGIDVSPLRSTLLVLTGVAGLWLFLRLDAHRDGDRLLPQHAWKLGQPQGAAMTLVFGLAVGTVALGAYAPVLMWALHGASALTAGYIIALSSIGWSAAAVLVANTPPQRETSRIIGGVALSAGSVIGLCLYMASGPLWLIALFAFLDGAGFGMAWSFVLRRASAQLSADEQARLASGLPTVQRAGYAIGAAWVGMIANSVGFDQAITVESAERAAFWVFAGSVPPALLGLWAAVRLCRTKPVRVTEAV